MNQRKRAQNFQRSDRAIRNGIHFFDCKFGHLYGDSVPLYFQKDDTGAHKYGVLSINKNILHHLPEGHCTCDAICCKAACVSCRWIATEPVISDSHFK